MDKKLTLSLNEEIIEQAKSYAREHQTSLSKMVENYLRLVVENSSKDVKITPLVKSLIGVIELPQDFDEKNNYTDFLMKKYK